MLAGTALDHRGSRAQGVQKAGALVADVHGWRKGRVGAVAQAQLLLEVDTVAREAVLGGKGGVDQHVQVGGLETRHL